MASSSSLSIEEETEQLQSVTTRQQRKKRSRVSLDFEECETESPASISEEEPILAGRGRGRARGRGRGGGGRRGKRVFKGRQFEEGEEERLEQLHQERKEKADELIEEMTDMERTNMLKDVAARHPAIIIDVAAVLSRRRQQGQPEPGPSASPQSWCVCTHCPPMDRDEDKLCCGMAPQLCNSLRPEMGLLVTDPLALHLQQTFRNDVFAHQAETVEDTNRAFRHAAYRQYILWVFGRLQKDDRRTVPACCVHIIRERYPSPTDQYTGFIPARQGVGW